MGADGTIQRTSNGGLNWVSQLGGIPMLQLNGVSFTDNNTGTVVGNNGVILRTTTGGTTWVQGDPKGSHETPNQFTLYQNYPNPFNPGTTIVYRVPSREFVELRVFDILGREVATLVNEIQDARPNDGVGQAGLKSVQWDATGFASGVYFYRLRVGNFVDTKKLVVLR